MTDVVAELTARIAKLLPAELAQLDSTIEAELSAPWLPNPGPQSDAYYSKADLLLYGGAAGGGKTDLLVGLGLTRHQRSVIFRRAFVDLRGVEERLLEIRGTRDGFNGSDKILRADGRVIEMGALEKPGAEMTWQGRPHDFYGFDEGAQLSAQKVRFVIGWLRSTSPGQRKRVVIASNPPIGGAGEWLIDWFAPWLDPMFPNPAKPGELRWALIRDDGSTRWVEGPTPIFVADDGSERPARPEEAANEDDDRILRPMSRTFIPALLKDNPYITAGYRAQLQSLDEPLRSQLLKGDFLAGRSDHEKQVIPSAWIDAAQERWARGKPSGVPMLALGVDVGTGSPDPSVLSPLYGTWFAEQKVVDGAATKDGPSLAGAVIQTMRDRCQITMDLTGGWGMSARDHLLKLRIDVLGVVFSAQSAARSRDGKFGFLNTRSQLWWQFREALDPNGGDDIALPPDRGLKAQLTSPTWRLRGDRIVIESKDEIRARLGASTDKADAAILAWHERGRAVFMQKHGDKLEGEWATSAPIDDPW